MRTIQNTRDVVHDVAAYLRRNSRTSALEASSHGLHSNITRHGRRWKCPFPTQAARPASAVDLTETAMRAEGVGKMVGEAHLFCYKAWQKCTTALNHRSGRENAQPLIRPGSLIAHHRSPDLTNDYAATPAIQLPLIQPNRRTGPASRRPTVSTLAISSLQPSWTDIRLSFSWI